MLRLTPLFAIATAAWSQAPGFEVATIKPAAPVTGHAMYHITMKTDAGRVDIANGSLTDLVRTAWRVNSYQVEGPDWMVTQKFDVAAKLPAGASKEQIPEMLQTLLAERFHLVIHRSTKPLPALALVVAKGGAKLKASPPGADGSGWSRSFNPEGVMRMETKNVTMPDLVQLVAQFLDYRLVDMTGLTGTYDVPLDFSPEDLRNGSKTSGVISPEEPGLPASGSAVIASLQLVGLKLESRKLPIELIVVDRLEKLPTAN